MLHSAAVAGDSLIVKNGKEGSKIRCIALWREQNEVTIGFGQLLSPLLHDSTRGFRYSANINTPHNVLPLGLSLELQAQDLLSFPRRDSVAGEGVNTHMLNFYDDFGTVDAHLITLAELKSRLKMLTTISNTITPIAEQVYSAPQLITAGSNLLMLTPNMRYLGQKLILQIAPSVLLHLILQIFVLAYPLMFCANMNVATFLLILHASMIFPASLFLIALIAVIFLFPLLPPMQLSRLQIFTCCLLN